MSTSFDINLNREEYSYKACYCEENIYKLAESRLDRDTNRGYVVFISNESKQIPIWSQKKGICNEYGVRDCVVWDYHVVYMCYHINQDSSSEELYIYDFDTVLPFPCSASNYCQNSFLMLSVHINKIQSKYLP